MLEFWWNSLVFLGVCCIFCVPSDLVNSSICPGKQHCSLCLQTYKTCMFSEVFLDPVLRCKIPRVLKNHVWSSFIETAPKPRSWRDKCSNQALGGMVWSNGLTSFVPWVDLWMDSKPVSIQGQGWRMFCWCKRSLNELECTKPRC